MSKTVVVTGATGTVGRHVVENLVALRTDVVALVRDETKARQLLAAGPRLAIGSFDDPGSLRKAFAGADTVVLTTAASAHAGAQAEAALAAARDAKVRKIVRLSAVKADPDGPTDNTRQHGRTEVQVRDSGLAYCILRPQIFMQNLLGSLGAILGSGKLYYGMGSGRMGMIDTRDVADCLAIAATRPNFDGLTLEITGPASIDFNTVAAVIGRGLGQDVTYVAVPPAAAGEAVRAQGADDWTARLVADYCAAYMKGFGDFTTDEVNRITGRSPRSLENFVREVLAPAARSMSPNLRNIR